jgi:hypothetical protein
VSLGFVVSNPHGLGGSNPEGSGMISSLRNVMGSPCVRSSCHVRRCLLFVCVCVWVWAGWGAQSLLRGMCLSLCCLPQLTELHWDSVESTAQHQEYQPPLQCGTRAPKTAPVPLLSPTTLLSVDG